MLRMKKGVVAGVTLAALLAGVTACSKPEPTPTPTPTVSSVSASPSPSPSPTPSPSFPTPSDSESMQAAAVRMAWQKYEETLDRYYRDPTLNDDWKSLYLVTTGVHTVDAAGWVQDVRKLGIKQVGYVSYRNVSVMEPVQNAQGVSVAQVTACADLSKHKMVYVKDGKPYTHANSGKNMREVVTLEQMPDKSWLVSNVESEFVTC